MPRNALATAILFAGVFALAWVANRGDEKEMVLSSKAQPKLRYTQKLRGPLDASLELVGPTPEKKGDVFVMKGLLSSERDLDNVNFKWAVPKGVELVNGSVSGHISSLRAGQPVEVQLTLKSLDSVNHQIHLITSGAQGKVRFGASAQYNTLLQQLLDDSTRALAASTEKEATEQKAQMKQSPDRHSHRKSKSKTKIQH